jgi:hypothetical protein
MLPEYNPIPKMPNNSKAGLTIRLNHKDDEEPFEATVFFKRSGKNPEELRDKDAINLIASGKIRLDIGGNGFVEIFAEYASRLKEAGVSDEPEGGDRGGNNEMPLL